jgi:DNA-binding LacI/PurR family transcriptional regulator
MSLPHHRQRLTGCERAINEVSDARLTILASKDLLSPKKFAAILHKNQITGLLCAERDLTHPTVHLIQQLPLQIPEDLSIVFLSTTWGVPYNNPTRVNLNRDFAGQVAVQRLIQRLEGQVQEYEQILIPCDFISGETTGPVHS